jgi:hypothetical protein
MEMVGHQAVRVEQPSAPDDDVLENPEEPAMVATVEEDRLPPVPS